MGLGREVARAEWSSGDGRIARENSMGRNEEEGKRKGLGVGVG